jgi:hypothetical protein
LTPSSDKSVKPYLLAIARASFNKHGFPVVPVYSSREEHDTDYRPGNRATVIAALDNLRVVDEQQLSWEQVTEFRNDHQNRLKYLRLLHWLDKDMVGKPRSFVEDEIALRLQDYEDALAKHGILTVLGLLSKAADGKAMLGASSLTASLALSGESTLGIIAGAGLLIGKVAVQVVEVLLDRDDATKGAHSEVSWVHEVKKNLGRTGARAGESSSDGEPWGLIQGT